MPRSNQTLLEDVRRAFSRFCDVVELRGRGQHGVVFKACLRLSNEIVALKVLDPEWMADDYVVKAFKAEIKTLAGLRHRNIVPVYFYREEGGYICYAMEWLPDGSLETLLKERGAFDEDATIPVLCQILEGIDFLHSQADPVIHRDLKPPNIMYDKRAERYLIADFGLAKVLTPEVTFTTGFIGTIAYMAPEQLNGEPASRQSDLYAIGVIGLELRRGKCPFADLPPATIVDLKRVPPIKELLTDLGGTWSTLVTVLLKAIAPDPSQRWSCAAEMRKVLVTPLMPPSS